MASSDDILNKILKTHASDGCRDADLNPLLYLVEDILNSANATAAPSQSQSEGNTTVLGQLSSVINRISCEISCKAMSKADPKSTTMTIFEMVGDYSWEVKLVMSIAAFALNYGNLLLLDQTHTSIQMAKLIALIRNWPTDIKQSVNLLKELIKAMMNVARCVVEFKTLPAKHVSREAPQFRAAFDNFRVAAYFTVRSVVACSSYISSLTHTSSQTTIIGFGSSTTQIMSMTVDSKSQFPSFELAGWTQALIKLHEILTKQLKACRLLIEEKEREEFYQMLVKLFEASQPDKVKILEALFCTDGGDRHKPLIHCSSAETTQIGIDMLVKKNVLLFISDLQISEVELVNIKAVHEKHGDTHEVVWIPIVDEWTEFTKTQFEKKKGWMPWYTMCQPESINQMVIRFVKEKWQFASQPMIMVLSADGKLGPCDAFHTVQVWGSQAFPFNSSKLDEIWRKVNWDLEFLIQTIVPSDSALWKSVKEENKLILLWGGYNSDKVEDINKLVYQAAGERVVEPIEVVYVGKSSKIEQVETTVKIITDKKVGCCLERVSEIELFWKRLESMLVSRIQLKKVEESDKVLYELQKLLHYDKGKGWFMLLRGSTIIASGPWSSIANALNKYKDWVSKVASDGFEKAFKDYLDGQALEHCCIELPFTIPGTGGTANLPMKCPECGRAMKKCITFTCSHEEPTSATGVSTTSTTTTTTTTTSTTATATATSASAN